MDNITIKFPIVGVSMYRGTKKKDGSPFICYTLHIDADGEQASIKTFDGSPEPGDIAEIGFGIKKTVYGKELVAEVKAIHKKGDK